MKSRMLGTFLARQGNGEVISLQQMGGGLTHAAKASCLCLSQIADCLMAVKMGEAREGDRLFDEISCDCSKVVGGRVDKQLGCVSVVCACMENERGTYARLFMGLKGWHCKSYWNQESHGGNSEDPTASRY
jgi:hypothetical protein